MMSFLKGRLAGNKGYTIDQTILIVAIIAILITLIIITVGWQLITRSTGTKLAAQLRQIEDANGQFYSQQHMWPYQAQSGTATGSSNMAALANQLASGSWTNAVDTSQLSNLIPGFTSSAAGVTQPNGGAVTEVVNTVDSVGLGSGKFIVVQFADVSLGDAEEADKAIDGEDDNKTGRLVYQANACTGATAMPTISAAPSNGTVNVCYVANAVQ